jgi:hypothetical protein
MSKFKDYKRFPIHLSRTNIALVHVYTYSPDHMGDLWMEGEEEGILTGDIDFDEQADQFIKQLEGKYCNAFLLALRNRINDHFTIKPVRKIPSIPPEERTI